ncbi:MAG: phosphoglycerate kinase [Patescibacteria group bacterium]
MRITKTGLKSIKNADIDIKNKKVILRTDFNVLVEKGKVTEGFRIEKSLPTIKFLKKKGAKIIIISHITESRGKSLAPAVEYLNKFEKAKLLGGILRRDVKKNISRMKNGDIVVLKNLRTDKREEKNDKIFSKKLAEIGDIYVNDAISVSHREHASVVGITKYLPSYAGFLFKDELENLSKALKPKHPFLLILGGIKFGTKLKVLEKFVKITDKIFVGGALANNFFKAQGKDIGNSIVDDKVSIKRYLNNPKIILPIDVRKSNNVILDAGPKTIKMLSKFIKKSKFILWNGPLGNFEKKGFEKGTESLARELAKSKAEVIVGGGDSVAVIDKLDLMKKFHFVSTAGGAMLEFLAQGTLPGIEALKKSKK